MKHVDAAYCLYEFGLTHLSLLVTHHLHSFQAIRFLIPLKFILLTSQLFNFILLKK